MWNRADNEPDFHTGSFFVYKVVGDERGTADEPGLDLVPRDYHLFRPDSDIKFKFR
jgi:hypothetical protein